MPGAKAPVLMMLRDEPLDTAVWPGSEPAERVASWALSVTDSVSYLGKWERAGADSIRVLFAFPPVLFGQGATFRVTGPDLIGEISNFSDVIGVKQGESRIAGIRIPCEMPRLVLPPPGEEDEEDIPAPPTERAGAGRKR